MILSEVLLRTFESIHSLGADSLPALLTRESMLQRSVGRNCE